MSDVIQTDAVIIGGGPVGLFAVFELGLLDIRCEVIDILDRAGGQCAELYPEKPIYDIPGYPVISGQELTDKLLEQAAPFSPGYHFNQMVEELEKLDDGTFRLKTDDGIEFRAPLRTSDRLQGVIDRLRSEVPALHEDRYMADDLKRADTLIRSGAIVETSGVGDHARLGEAA